MQVLWAQGSHLQQVHLDDIPMVSNSHLMGDCFRAKAAHRKDMRVGCRVVKEGGGGGWSLRGTKTHNYAQKRTKTHNLNIKFFFASVFFGRARLAARSRLCNLKVGWRYQNISSPL